MSKFSKSFEEEGGAQAGAGKGSARPTPGIEDITSRLEELLRTMGDMPEPGPRERAIEGEILEAARHAYRTRRVRERLFGAAILADPGWDILLDLFIAGEEGRKVSIDTATVAIEVDEATVLRCIAGLIEERLIMRQPNPADPANMYLMLTDGAKRKICDYFNQTRIRKGAADA